VADGEIKLVHCRSFPPAVIGHELKRKFGTKFIFDFRYFYADWGLQHTRGVKWLLYARMKQLEGQMIRAADKVVCLTYRATGVLADWYLKDRTVPARTFQVIPCCADFAHFDSSRVPPAKIAAVRERIGIKPETFVMLYLGSLGPDYLLPQMMVLFKVVLRARPNACFLFVANNGQAWVDAECKRHGIDSTRIRFVAVPREDIPTYLALADLSVVFKRASTITAGDSPTKLAELFACNVPVIANTGVGDLDAIIDPDRNGSVIIGDFSDETLHAAVETVLAAKQKITTSIRENSREFALEEGVARYAAVYRELLNQ
jgi:glycosyltransferase involved in cell wall biosynthesis